jgi:hypothetical protein
MIADHYLMMKSFGPMIADKWVCSICISIISLFETWLSKVDIYFYVDMFY